MLTYFQKAKIPISNRKVIIEIDKTIFFFELFFFSCRTLFNNTFILVVFIFLFLI